MAGGVLDDGGVVHLENIRSYFKLRGNTILPVHRRGRLFYLNYIGSSLQSGDVDPTVAAATMVRPPDGLPSAGKIGGAPAMSAAATPSQTQVSWKTLVLKNWPIFPASCGYVVDWPHVAQVRFWRPKMPHSE